MSLIYDKKAIRVTELSNIPSYRHWVIFEKNSYSTDHGYPEDGSHTYYYLDYFAYLNKEDWVEAIKNLKLENKDFKAMEVSPATILVEVEVR